MQKYEIKNFYKLLIIKIGMFRRHRGLRKKRCFEFRLSNRKW